MFYTELQKALPNLKIEKVTVDNALDVALIVKSNTYFIEKTQNHPVTVEESIEDITSLPPKKEMRDKTYCLIYKSGKAVAVVDFLEGYSVETSCFLGFFILDSALHGKGLGTEILAALENISKDKGYTRLELGCYLENAKGLGFWKSKGFLEEKRMPRTIDDLNLTLIKLYKNI